MQRDPWWMTWGARILVGALVAFTIWLLFVIFVDPSPGPCVQLGGC